MMDCNIVVLLYVGNLVVMWTISHAIVHPKIETKTFSMKKIYFYFMI